MQSSPCFVEPELLSFSCSSVLVESEDPTRVDPRLRFKVAMICSRAFASGERKVGSSFHTPTYVFVDLGAAKSRKNTRESPAELVKVKRGATDCYDSWGFFGGFPHHFWNIRLSSARRLTHSFHYSFPSPPHSRG